MHQLNRDFALTALICMFVSVIIFSPRTTIAMLDEKAVVVTEKDKDELIKVRKGQTLVVKLKCQPGTGYSWKVAKSCTERLKLEGKPTLEADDEKDGAEETQIFRFKAKTEGQGKLKLEYKRPFGEEKVAKAFNVEVKISDQ